jgi:aminoglycoside phosphotransferase (APT) family kinase protein
MGSPKLLHGDFWPENLLWQQGAVAAVVDWEDAALGDPLSDVAASRVELRYKFGKGSMRRFTEAYAKHHKVDRARLALWQVYVAAAAQRYMGGWGLDPALEAHMRAEALVSIREAGDELMGNTAQ